MDKPTVDIDAILLQYSWYICDAAEFESAGDYIDDYLVLLDLELPTQPEEFVNWKCDMHSFLTGSPDFNIQLLVDTFLEKVEL